MYEEPIEELDIQSDSFFQFACSVQVLMQCKVPGSHFVFSAGSRTAPADELSIQVQLLIRYMFFNISLKTVVNECRAFCPLLHVLLQLLSHVLYV